MTVMIAVPTSPPKIDPDSAPDPTDRASHYQSNGVVLVPRVFTPSEITHIRDIFTTQVESDSTFSALDRHISPDDILARYPRFVQPHRHPESDAGRIARGLMVDERLLGIVENLIGPAYGAQSMFYFKPPTARGQAMHQDNFFLQSHPETCLAAWIAIDDSDASNGGLIVIPGSHRNEVLCHEEAADPTISFSTKTVRLPHDRTLERLQTELRAGDVLFFHGSLVHGSLPNNGEAFRRALIFHYIPQASEEVAVFYQPLIAPSGEEVRVGVSPEGGLCGETWAA